MSSITDWLMVIITGIYMFATIAIFVANLISSKTAKNQLEQTRRQFEEENRPNIETEFHFFRRRCFSFAL